jgi:hypothetical protein
MGVSSGYAEQAVTLASRSRAFRRRCGMNGNPDGSTGNTTSGPEGSSAVMPMRADVISRMLRNRALMPVRSRVGLSPLLWLPAALPGYAGRRR